jgi:hypothetical protein
MFCEKTSTSGNESSGFAACRSPHLTDAAYHLNRRRLPLIREITTGRRVTLTTAVHPLTLEVARLAGRIHGEQMGQGVSIDFPDLIIV